MYTLNRGEAQSADQIHSEEDMPNDPKAVELPLANATEFITAIWSDLEWAFNEQFGARWTPAIQQLYQDSLKSCLAVARVVDDGMAQPSTPVQHSRVLTLYPKGRSGSAA